MFIFQIQANQILAGTYDRYGNGVQRTSKEVTAQIARRVDQYYKDWNNPIGPPLGKKIIPLVGGIGLGKLIASFETVTALLLGYLQRSPATFTNAATTLSEFVQTIIAGRDTNSSEEQNQKGENLMAGAISLAGGIGLYNWFKDLGGAVKGEGEEMHQLSFFPKLALSTASLVSSVLMAISYAEKTSLAPIAKVENQGKRAKEMSLNGKSDMRCAIEWAAMTVFPWLVHIKPAKLLLDLALPLGALQSGFGHYLNEWWDEKRETSMVKVAGQNLVNVCKKVFEIASDEVCSVPKVFLKDWYFGKSKSGGIRGKILPVFRFFGCIPPDCHLDGKNLVTQFSVNEKLNTDKSEVNPRLTTVLTEGVKPLQTVDSRV